MYTCMYNIMNGEYPQHICKYCKMNTTFYCVGCGFGTSRDCNMQHLTEMGFINLSGLYRFHCHKYLDFFITVLISWFEFFITIPLQTVDAF